MLCNQLDANVVMGVQEAEVKARAAILRSRVQISIRPNTHKAPIARRPANMLTTTPTRPSRLPWTTTGSPSPMSVSTVADCIHVRTLWTSGMHTLPPPAFSCSLRQSQTLGIYCVQAVAGLSDANTGGHRQILTDVSIVRYTHLAGRRGHRKLYMFSHHQIAKDIWTWTADAPDASEPAAYSLVRVAVC